MHRWLSGVICLVGLAAPALADEAVKSITIQRFDVEMQVHPDATVQVQETLKLRFQGSWNGIKRDVPVEEDAGWGRTKDIGLSLDSVTDDQGKPLKVEESRSGGIETFKIWVPGANNAARTIRIRYKLANTLRFFDAQHASGAHDELYWNVTGNQWDMPIEKATARIRLPEGVKGVRADAFQGASGSSEKPDTVKVQGNLVTVQSSRPFSPYEGLTVVVGWDPGVVARPSAADVQMELVRYAWPLSIPILVFFGMLALWWRVGKDPAPRSIVVQYEPPADLTPGELGTLVDHKAQMQDLTATLIDLAVRGFLTIEEVEEPKFLIFGGGKDYLFHRVQSSGNLVPHERLLFEGLFKPGRDSVRLSDLRNEFYQQIPGINKALYDRLIQKKFYRTSPQTMRSAAIAAAFVVNFVTFALGVVFNPLLIAAAFLSAGIITVFAWILPARTVMGARQREACLGFKEFLARVDSEKYKRMITSPEQFERYLPYAMALNVEEKWAAAFDDLYREPPNWYRGYSGDHFRVSGFTHDLSRMTSQAAQTMSSSPSSSGSSGFSGGSSGGGSGGGGGSGF